MKVHLSIDSAGDLPNMVGWCPGIIKLCNSGRKGMSAARGSLGIKSLRSLNLRAHPTKSCKGVGHLQKPTLPRGFGSRSVMAQRPRVEPNRTLTKKKVNETILDIWLSCGPEGKCVSSWAGQIGSTSTGFLGLHVRPGIGAGVSHLWAWLCQTSWESRCVWMWEEFWSTRPALGPSCDEILCSWNYKKKKICPSTSCLRNGGLSQQ